MQAIVKIAVEGFLKEGENCKNILGREILGNMSDSDFQVALPIFEEVRAKENAILEKQREIEAVQEKERLSKLPSIVQVNRALFQSHTIVEKKITKSFLNSFITPWSNSRWGVRKADVINQILGFRNAAKDARMYCSATYTEKSGCHGYNAYFYVDYELHIIAKVHAKNADAFDFTPYKITEILEIYKMI